MMTNQISLIIVCQIAFVFTPYDIPFHSIGSNFSPGCEKHRPNNVAVSDWYACESFGTTSPGKVQKHRFDAIIKVMRCCDGAVSVFFNQVFDPLIAKIPDSHLDGYPLL